MHRGKKSNKKAYNIRRLLDENGAAAYNIQKKQVSEVNYGTQDI